jgi:hypothetical protein
MRSLVTTILLFLITTALAQNGTYSPYSRYGLGELSATSLSHNQGMGNAHIALRPDSTMPIFLNPGNPASYPLIRLTTLEVGGRFGYSAFSTAGTTINKWNTHFSYGAIGIPIGLRSGLCFGLMPYSHVGFESESRQTEEGIGELTNRYNGSGGLSKVFLGYGIMPFQKRWIRFRNRYDNLPDSLQTLSPKTYRLRNFGSRFLSDLSIGANANYVFGSIQNTARVIYPNSIIYNNTYLENVLSLADFTGNFGLQGGFTADSVKKAGKRRGMKERVRVTFGVFMNLQNPLKARYSDVGYNYILSGTGEELIRDTVRYDADQPKKITLPLEQGFGIGFKKGEKLNIVADIALTGWSRFTYPGQPLKLKDSYRMSIGMNFVPEKYAAGRAAFWRRVNYRAGLSHETGFITLKGQSISNSFASLGMGIPVGIGRLSSMVNISVQAGTMGTTADGLLSENYLRVHFGFTFCDRWFQKFRYD